MFGYPILHKTSGLVAGVLCCLVVQLQSAAQGSQGNQQNASAGFGSTGQIGVAMNDLTRSVEIFGQGGNGFVNPYRDVAGSPYLRDAWSRADLRLNDKAIVPNLRVRLDLKSQQWHFLDSINVERLIAPGVVREVLVDDSSGVEVKTTVFRSGFPPVDSRKSTDFYQVMCDGKVQLLHSMLKIIKVDKDEMSGSVDMAFVLYEDYYVFSGGKMWRFKKERSAVLDLLGDKKEKIQAFTDQNHLKLKSADELKQVIDYYNTLP